MSAGAKTDAVAPRRVRMIVGALLPLVVFILPSNPVGGPGAWTLLPPLFAISLAFATSRAILPLAGGVWLGATMIAWQSGDRVLAPLLGAWNGVDQFIIRTSIYDDGTWMSFNLSVIGFVFALVGMVAVAIRAGGMAGVAERFTVFARSPRSVRISAWLLGLVVFFDDYANSLIVGGTMRPLTDRMRVSREKLAWLVDSTAAPVAGLSILSTWIAYEISQFEPQLPDAGFAAGSGFAVFIQTLPFRFYCILTIVFVGAMSIAGRDFGPMLKAERRAFETGAVFRPGARPLSAEGDASAEPKEGIAHRAHVALLPVAITLGTIVALFVQQGELTHAAVAGTAGHTGSGLSLLHMREVLGGVSDNTFMLFLGAMTGLTTVVVLAMLERLLTLVEALKAAISGSRAMTVAVVVLMLAWAMAAVCGKVDEGGLGTREYMASIAPMIPPLLLPAGLFLLSCAVAFATGSSWSTMGILLPIVIGLAASVGEASMIGGQAMVIITIGAVLDGSIFGDHCSPISDTTILSSTAAGSDHMDHVRTQAPYAITVMSIALLAGYLPAAAGLPPAMSLLAGAALIGLVVMFVARPVEG